MQRARGTTLIELIIVTVVIGIMAAIMAPLMLSTLRANDDILGDVVVLDKLRYATERLAREIREVQYASSTTVPPTNCGETTNPTTDHYCITTMNANSLTFRRYYTDSAGTLTGNDVAVSSTSSTVTLAYSDMVTTGAQVLTDELGATSNLAFAYYQQDGTTAATLAGNANCIAVVTCVSYVEISIKLRHNNNDYIQRTRIALRNPPI